MCRYVIGELTCEWRARSLVEWWGNGLEFFLYTLTISLDFLAHSTVNDLQISRSNLLAVELTWSSTLSYFFIFSVVSGPTTLCFWAVLMLWRNLPIQPPTRNTRHSSCFSSSSSKTSLFPVFSTARANNSRVCFNSSAFDSWVDVVTRSGGQSCGFANRLGPCHQRAVNLLTSPPLLPTSAGFSSVGTCLQLIRFSWIFLPWFPTNCLYSPFLRIQCSAIVLSSQP